MARTINIEERQNLNVVHHFRWLCRYICVYVNGCAGQRSTLSIVLQASTTLICVCLYVYVFWYKHVHTHVFTYGGQRSMSGIFLHCSITYIFERGSYWSRWPVVLWNSISLWPTSAGVTDMCCLAWPLHRFGDWNQVLIPAQQAFYLLSHLPSPQSRGLNAWFSADITMLGGSGNFEQWALVRGHCCGISRVGCLSPLSVCSQFQSVTVRRAWSKNLVPGGWRVWRAETRSWNQSSFKLFLSGIVVLETQKHWIQTSQFSRHRGSN